MLTAQQVSELHGAKSEEEICALGRYNVDVLPGIAVDELVVGVGTVGKAMANGGVSEEMFKRYMIRHVTFVQIQGDHLEL